MMILLVGRQGSGKTLLMVKMAYDYWKEGKTIYSNVKLNFPFKQIDYNDIVNCKLKNAVVLLDEVHQLLPSRNSMSKINRTIVDGFLSMIRKQNLIVIGTTQLEMKVDVRFREEKDFIYECFKYAYLDGRWENVIHSQNFDINTPVLIRVEAEENYSGVRIRFNLFANAFYHLYDTNEIIQVRGIEL